VCVSIALGGTHCLKKLGLVEADMHECKVREVGNASLEAALEEANRRRPGGVLTLERIKSGRNGTEVFQFASDQDAML
jgi:hypothetical protein